MPLTLHMPRHLKFLSISVVKPAPNLQLTENHQSGMSDIEARGLSHIYEKTNAVYSKHRQEVILKYVLVQGHIKCKSAILLF